MTTARRTVFAVSILLFTILTDLASKEWALSALSDGRRIELLPTLEFDLLFNRGFSFGTGQGRGRLIGVAVIAMVIYLTVQLVRAKLVHRVVLLSVILGGAIGNLLDRIFRADDGFLSGAVVDFIDVSWFAVFNVADIYVVCGAIGFALWELALGSDDNTDQGSPSPQPSPAKSELIESEPEQADHLARFSVLRGARPL